MAFQKFKISVTRTDEFEISVDDSVWTPEAIKEWSSVFSDADSIQQIAEQVALSISRYGSSNNFYEGFGTIQKYITTADDQLYGLTDFETTPEGISKIEPTKAISAVIISEDEDYEFETETL